MEMLQDKNFLVSAEGSEWWWCCEHADQPRFEMYMEVLSINLWWLHKYVGQENNGSETGYVEGLFYDAP